MPCKAALQRYFFECSQSQSYLKRAFHLQEDTIEMLSDNTRLNLICFGFEVVFALNSDTVRISIGRIDGEKLMS